MPAPPHPGTPLVSLLIPVHNQVALTRACLASVFAHADPKIATEIIVIDDASSDETPAYLASLGDRIRVIRNDTPAGFASNMNSAAALATAPFLLLLNNDTVVTPHWLAALLKVAARDPHAAVIGNCQLYPSSGLINHAGMVFDSEGLCQHLYAGKPADFPPAGITRRFQAVTGACWLVPAPMFAALGGFDVGFRNGHEDVDFCLRAGLRGHTVWYAADSVIYHHVASSTGRHDHEDANALRFAEKWRGRVAADRDIYLARDGQIPPMQVEDAMLLPPGLLARRLVRSPALQVAWRALLRLPGALRAAEAVLLWLQRRRA